LKNYLKGFVHTEIYRVNQLLKEGWELIETCKVTYPDGGKGAVLQKREASI